MNPRSRVSVYRLTQRAVHGPLGEPRSVPQNGPPVPQPS